MLKQKTIIMKKVIIGLSFVISGFFVQSCNERAETKMRGNIPEADVPASVKTSFSAKYPGATDVEWEKESENGKILYEAECKFNGKEVKVKFDANGNFVSQEDD